MASDERLVDLVRQGSQPAFEVIYDRHHRGILAFCRHMLGSREEAEDAVQHTFMAAYRDLVGSGKEIQLRAWLYAIARNRCLSVLRQRRDRPVDELEDVPTAGLADEVQRRADLQAMLRDLAELPEDQRAALVLAEIGDLPHEEIAAVIGCRKEKVKALVFQARSSLNASREARDTDCAEIREQLSTLRGGALRRTSLRRHLKVCPGCRAFKDEVERQRRAMAVLLPVAPTIGLKSHVLSSVFGTGSAAGAAGVAASAGGTAAGVTAAAGSAGGATVASGGGAVLAAKALVVAVAVGGGAIGIKEARTVVKAHDSASPAAVDRRDGHHAGSSGPSKTPKAPKGAPAVLPALVGGGEKAKGKWHSAHGHTDRGKAFAKTRGEGLKRGLEGTQPGKTGVAPAHTPNPNKPATPPGKGKPETVPTPVAKGRAKPHPTAQPHPTPKPEATPKPQHTPVPKPAATPKPVKTPASGKATPDVSSEATVDATVG